MIEILTQPTPNCSCTAVHTPLDCPTHGAFMRRQVIRDAEWRAAEMSEVKSEARFNFFTHIDADGAPCVVMEDVNTGKGYTFNPAQALQLGLRFVRLAEEVVTNKLLHESLVERGMSDVEANAYVDTFQRERARIYRGG